MRAAFESFFGKKKQKASGSAAPLMGGAPRADAIAAAARPTANPHPAFPADMSGTYTALADETEAERLADAKAELLEKAHARQQLSVVAKTALQINALYTTFKSASPSTREELLTQMSHLLQAADAFFRIPEAVQAGDAEYLRQAHTQNAQAIFTDLLSQVKTGVDVDNSAVRTAIHKHLALCYHYSIARRADFYTLTSSTQRTMLASHDISINEDDVRKALRIADDTATEATSLFSTHLG